MKYEVWLNARHPKTLESVAAMRVFAHEDRLKAEGIAETAQADFGGLVNLLRIWQPGAVVNSEVRTVGGGGEAIVLRAALERIVSGSLIDKVNRNDDGISDYTSAFAPQAPGKALLREWEQAARQALDGSKS